MSDIAVAKFVIAEKLVPAVRGGENVVSQQLRARSRRRVFAASTAGLVAGIMVTALIAWRATRAVQPPPHQPVRFTFAPRSPLTLGLQGSYRHIALSPDGSRLVYQSETIAAGQQLVVRPLDQLEPQPLTGIVGRAPFVSPDGRWIGYFEDNELRKVSVLGGPPITICKTLPATPRGATWTADGTIIFAVADSRTGLFSVPAGGGDATPLTRPEAFRILGFRPTAA